MRTSEPKSTRQSDTYDSRETLKTTESRALRPACQRCSPSPLIKVWSREVKACQPFFNCLSSNERSQGTRSIDLVGTLYACHNTFTQDGVMVFDRYLELRELISPKSFIE